MGPERMTEFIRKGYLQRTFFPHSVVYLPKCGPDGFKLARRMCGDEVRVNDLWEIVLYAAPSLVERFPREVFFDDDVVWHQQQFGREGQVATANLVVQGSELTSMVHISDLVQRISRRRELKTQVENRFKGWNHMLLNGILHFAWSQDLTSVRVPTSEWAMRHTDPTRTIGPEMFDRIYDRNVREIFDVEGAGPWWSIDVERNVNRLVVPEPSVEALPQVKAICLCHDVERGMGHTASDPDFARRAEETADGHLDRMLAIEGAAGVTATYNVVGAILPELRARIEAGGHCLAFHSYDHRIEGETADGRGQLDRCRDLDYRIKGYRVPQSKLTPELSDENLCFHNFEWIASSAYAWGFSQPILENRIVKIPVHFDDFAMYHDGQPYDAWEEEALRKIEENEFVAFCLHDCYGELWLPRYASFLEKVGRLGTFRTMNEVASEVTLRSSAWFEHGAPRPELAGERAS